MSADTQTSNKKSSRPSAAEPSAAEPLTPSTYTPASNYLDTALLYLNFKCARIRKGLYLRCSRSSNEGEPPMPNVTYYTSQPWTQSEMYRFNATAEMPGTIIGAENAESVWLLPWGCGMNQLPVMDLDDLPDPESQSGWVYLAGKKRDVEAFEGVEQIIGIGMGLLKLVEIGGGQDRLDFKEKGKKLDGFVDLGWR